MNTDRGTPTGMDTGMDMDMYTETASKIPGGIRHSVSDFFARSESLHHQSWHAVNFMQVSCRIGSESAPGVMAWSESLGWNS